ncbi:type II secretion system F family protein [bacterium]|nr:type II secretion system F family protein [bacterium]
MPFYDYRVKTQSGKVQKGKVEAASVARAAETLQQKGLFIISIEPVAEGSALKVNGHSGKMKFQDVVIFTRQLAAIVEAGLTLTTGIGILIKQSTPNVKIVLEEILNDLESGKSFSQALEKHPTSFDGSYIYLVQAGESSGSLDIVLNRLADTMENQNEFRNKIVGALIYPAIVILVMIAVVVVMMTMVIPKLISVFEEFGAELPLPTRILMGISNMFVHYWWAMLLAIGVGVSVFWVWYQNPDAKRVVDRISFKVPIYGNLSRKVILTNYTSTLALLVRSGVPLVESLSLAAESVSSIVLRDHLREIQEKVEKGISFGTAIEAYDDFPMIMSQMIKVGEETGKMDEILVKLSSFFHNEASTAVDGLMAAFEPILMVILGLVVAFLVIAIILPIYQLTDQISV